MISNVEHAMAQILVRNLPDSVKARLKRRAEANNHSLEAEVRALLVQAPEPPAVKGSGSGLASKLAQQFAAEKLPVETWAEFDKNIATLRAAWKVRDGGIKE
jgi:plasmid stability protein